MKKVPAPKSQPTDRIPVISISPFQDDHTFLKSILSRSEAYGFSSLKWTIHPFLTAETALPVARTRSAIVMCERDLSPGTWKQVLAEIRPLPDPPLLIVTSRHADDYLWAEALNLGAYDVLAKPFNAEEVLRVVNLACLHCGRHTEFRKPASPVELASAG
jgi:DNA-binding response OmpR family regulator